MPAFFTPQSASPHSIKYFYLYDGVGGAGSEVATRTRAQILTDFETFEAPGPNPLKELLRNSDLGVWDNLPNNSKLSIYVHPCSNGVPQPGFTPAALFTSSSGERLEGIGVNGQGMTAMIEIRFNHTFDR